MSDTLDRAFKRGCEARPAGGGEILILPYPAGSEHAKRYRVGWYAIDAVMMRPEEENQAAADVLL